MKIIVSNESVNGMWQHGFILTNLSLLVLSYSISHKFGERINERENDEGESERQYPLTN